MPQIRACSKSLLNAEPATPYSRVRYPVVTSSPTTSATTYRIWERLAGRPGGSWLFSAAAVARVPYFASILPHVTRMEPGLAEVTAGAELCSRQRHRQVGVRGRARRHHHLGDRLPDPGA